MCFRFWTDFDDVGRVERRDKWRFYHSHFALRIR
jgi:hypothetical protein